MTILIQVAFPLGFILAAMIGLMGLNRIVAPQPGGGVLVGYGIAGLLGLSAAQTVLRLYPSSDVGGGPALLAALANELTDSARRWALAPAVVLGVWFAAGIVALVVAGARRRRQRVESADAHANG